MKTFDAIEMARSEDLDLIVVAEKTEPPVAKILDFNKFLYEERKKSSSSKARKSELKELRFGPTIGEGDLKVRMARIREFLQEGHQIRVRVQLKGREKAYPQLGFDKIQKIVKEVENEARIEGEPKRIGGDIIVTFIKK